VVTSYSTSPGWNAQGGGALALILGDQRGARESGSACSFDFIARRHPVAVAMKQHPGEQARLVSAGASFGPAAGAGELSLNRIPKRLIGVLPPVALTGCVGLFRSTDRGVAVFETREPEPIPIRRIPGLRDAIEPLKTE